MESAHKTEAATLIGPLCPLSNGGNESVCISGVAPTLVRGGGKRGQELSHVRVLAALGIFPPGVGLLPANGDAEATQ